jgi:hypothetical protein
MHWVHERPTMPSRCVTYCPIVLAMRYSQPLRRCPDTLRHSEADRYCCVAIAFTINGPINRERVHASTFQASLES